MVAHTCKASAWEVEASSQSPIVPPSGYLTPLVSAGTFPNAHMLTPHTHVIENKTKTNSNKRSKDRALKGSKVCSIAYRMFGPQLENVHLQMHVCVL